MARGRGEEESMEDVRGKTVLVVDDEPNVRLYLQTVLEDSGFEVQTAANGHQALDRMTEKKPDVISLDLVMPKMSGLNFFKYIQKNKEQSGHSRRRRHGTCKGRAGIGGLPEDREAQVRGVQDLHAGEARRRSDLCQYDPPGPGSGASRQRIRRTDSPQAGGVGRDSGGRPGISQEGLGDPQGELSRRSR